MKQSLKHLKFAALALLLSAGFAACSDDESEVITPKDWTNDANGAYVINQGNQYGGVAGSVSYLDLTTWNVTDNVFQAANDQSLGDTPQAAFHYGSKIYVPVYGSNKVWVVDGTTLKKVAEVTTNEPEAVCGAGKYVFVTNNDGKLTRVDTLSYETSQIEVGPNPANLCEANGKIYVSISDGYNYANAYANGKKVAVVNPETFTKERDVTVGTNPGAIVADKWGYVYVVARGDYYTEMPKVQRIAPDYTVTDYCAGQLVACKDNRLYVVDYTADYSTNTCNVQSALYLTSQDASATPAATTGWTLDAAHLPEMPNALDINPANGDLYICADNGPLGYSTNGFVYVYSADGAFKAKANVGIHPYGVVFTRK